MRIRPALALPVIASFTLLLAGCASPATSNQPIQTIPPAPGTGTNSQAPTAQSSTSASTSASATPAPVTTIKSTPIPGGGTFTLTSQAPPASGAPQPTTKPAKAITTGSDLNQVVSLVQTWPANPKTALDASGMKEYEKTSVEMYMPAGTTVVADRKTWETHGNTGSIEVMVSYPNRSIKGNITVTKHAGIWKISLVILGV